MVVKIPFQRDFASGLAFSTFPVFCVLMLCPVLALPFIICGMYRQQKGAYFLFSLFLGLLSWLQIPSGDLFRHTMQYYEEFGRPIGHVFDFSTGFHDFIATLGKWILVNNSLSFQYFRLFSMTESFYVLSLIYLWMIKKSPVRYTREQAFVRFIFLFLFFEFVQTTSGTRYCFAVYNYIYGVHLLFNLRKRFLSLIFFAFAVCIHDTLLFLIPLSFVIYMGCKSRKRGLTILIVCSILALAVISSLTFLMGRRAEFYFEDGNSLGGNTFQDVTIYGFILFTLSRVFLIPFGYLSFKYFNPNAPWVRMMMVWTILMCVFISNGVMIFRIAVFMSAIIPYLIIGVEKHAVIRHGLFKVLMFCAVMNTVFNTVNYRTYLVNSRFEYIFTPVPVILSYVYERPWILENIDNNTILKPRINL